ncbi:hypothetical protein [Thetidibacter halocola]|uniref:Uncharacterized protein n=1 Tax=Thetidibacter halocola TaxID=2827239 RepID=A0A8J8B8C1_9RHOB|nr:hypothetical protein [Thetidibacter halocola]MBS0126061.1 hypothetical protein [Thetidibacter halocola]
MTFDEAFDFPASHWGELVAYLTMDLTDAVWPQLGLRLERDMDTARDDLRRMIVQLRETAAAHPDNLPDIREWLFRYNVPGWTEAELQSLCDMGCRFVADHADAPHLSGWSIALGSFPDSFPRTIEASGTSGAAPALAKRLAERGVPVTAPTKLSAWDLQLCARHGWNPESDEGFPPIDTTDIVLSLARTDSLLRDLARTMPPAAQRALHQEATALLDEWGVWMPAPLDPLHLKVDDAAH